MCVCVIVKLCSIRLLQIILRESSKSSSSSQFLFVTIERESKKKEEEEEEGKKNNMFQTVTDPFNVCYLLYNKVGSEEGRVKSE